MRWLPHLSLLGIAALMLVVARVRHVPTPEALQTAFDETADADDRIWATHLAACRATEADLRLGESLVTSFLDSGDDRLAEAAMLIDLCRHAVRGNDAPAGASPPLQDAYAYGRLGPSGWTPHRFRTLMFYRRKVGGSYVGGVRRMDLTELTWLIAAIRGEAIPPSDVIAEYLTERSGEFAGLPRPGSAPR
ncbi:MAG: hypothetical protein AAF726_05165 [Planctomycetota bacterium]